MIRKQCFPLSCVWCFGCWIPHRYICALMVFFGMVVTFLLRMSSNFSITVMTTPIETNENVSHDACPAVDEVTNTSEKYGNLNWTNSQQSILLGTFYPGYTLSQVPVAIIADKFGGKYPMSTGILITAICQILIPILVNAGGDYYGYIYFAVMRVTQGIGAGFVYTCVSPFVAKWIPIHERGKFATLMFSGLHIGCFCSFIFTGYLTKLSGLWEVPFYVYGGIAIVWYAFFILFCHSSYASHPYLTDKEYDYLSANIVLARRNVKTPWKKILSCCPFWALLGANICHDFTFFTLINELPKYMKTILRFHIGGNAIFSALPYLCMWIFAIVGGIISDVLDKKNLVSRTKIRKIFMTIGLFCPGTFMVAAVYAGCNRAIVVTLFCCCLATMGCYYCSGSINFVDIAPTFAATINSISNSCGAIQGSLSSLLISAIVKENTLTAWKYVYWITWVYCVIATILYLIFGTAERQKWDIDAVDAAEKAAQDTKKG